MTRPRQESPAAEDWEGVAPKRVARLEDRLHQAGRAYSAGRYGDSTRMARAIVREAPTNLSARELLGLSLYQQGKWKAAHEELSRFAEESGSTEQHPVLEDCARARKQYGEVKSLWDELRRDAPSPEIVAEGRVVMAGALVDQGKLQDAFRLLEPYAKNVRSPKDYHIRQWYVLADILERMGELDRARRLFERIMAASPGYVDVKSRLRSLR